MSEISQAPRLTLPASNGDTVTLPGTGSKGAVVFFYPKDNTSGCTKEAQGFTAAKEDFAALGIEIYGISKDSLKSHDNFITKQGLSVTLLSDEDGAACAAFDVWREKSMYGKKFFGIERSTFLIAADGRILREWRKVKVPGHVEAVLDAARTLF